MNDNTARLEQTDDEILSFEVADEALESAAGVDKAEPFTLGACTGLSVCPG
jgi:hypothetical protein